MPQISAPLPFTVKTPLLNVALPAAPTAPMSPFCQGLGSDPPPPASWMENRPDRPNPSSPSASTACTSTFALSVTGPGLFQVQEVAVPGRLLQTVCDVPTLLLMTETKTSIRVIGVSDDAVNVIVYGLPAATTSPAFGAVTVTVGNTCALTVKVTDDDAVPPWPSSTVTVNVYVPGWVSETHVCGTGEIERPSLAVHE